MEEQRSKHVVAENNATMAASGKLVNYILRSVEVRVPYQYINQSIYLCMYVWNCGYDGRYIPGRGVVLPPEVLETVDQRFGCFLILCSDLMQWLFMIFL